MQVEIYLSDLKPAKQREVANLFNPDPIPHPLAILVDEKKTQGNVHEFVDEAVKLLKEEKNPKVYDVKSIYPSEYQQEADDRMEQDAQIASEEQKPEKRKWWQEKNFEGDEEYFF